MSNKSINVDALELFNIFTLDRRQNPDERHDDFIQLFLEARLIDELDKDTQGPNMKFKNKRLTENEMIANAYGFLLAGNQTTCIALSYCLHELALNQDVQQKLYDEIYGAIDSDGQIPYDNVLARLPYLDAVLSETMRRHLAVMPISRIAAIDYTLGDTGITIKAGQQIEIPIYSIHNSDNSGSRNCVGKRFAILKIKMSLAQLIRNYRFSRCPETDDQIRYQKFIHFMLPERLFVGIEARI
ncbi:unnamed protein product [Oppiella nova]|uniref:Cytochrome P450 n=1 Tax=Oppiella nova TaxID=334625 RepID=A0A7R9QS30_9ACAR|nr:unnamed protein product [Oppiella nova]CAG2171869.1 unnamed protein product [Oppiella nova]